MVVVGSLKQIYQSVVHPKRLNSFEDQSHQRNLEQNYTTSMFLLMLLDLMLGRNVYEHHSYHTYESNQPICKFGTQVTRGLLIVILNNFILKW